MSTNDRSTGATAATSIANLAAYQAAILATGKRLIWVAEFPRGDADDDEHELAGTQLAYHMQVRRWIMAQASVPGVYVADPWPEAADESSVDGWAKPGMLKDSIHPAPAGALAIARALAPIIETLLPPLPRGPAGAADLYGADNPSGSLVANPMMLGDEGSGGTGDVATEWVVSAASGVTATCAKITDDAGREWQQIAVSGTPASGTTAVSLTADLDPNDLSEGDRIETTAEIQIEAGHSGLHAVPVIVQLTDAGAGALGVAGHAYSVSGDINLALPPGPHSGIAVVPAVTVGADTSAGIVSVRIICAAGAAVSATIRVRAVSAHKI